MDKKEEGRIPASSVPTDVEVNAAAEQLSLRWTHSTPRLRAVGNQILQRLAHGRSHVVALEIKRSPRRIGGSR